MTSSFVPLADVLVEHRVYLASWGIWVALAALCERLVARRTSPAAGALAVAALSAACLVLAWALYQRNAVWETQLALSSDSALKSPNKARVHLSLGYAFREAGRHAEAIAEYEKALRCPGLDLTMEIQLLRNLGAALIWADRHDEAVAVLERAAAKAPEPDIMTNLAIAFLGKWNLRLAEEYARRAISMDRGQGEAWNALGVIQLQRRELEPAQRSFERAIEVDPDVGVRHYNLGKVLAGRGDERGACAAWRRALAATLTQAMRAEVSLAAARKNCLP